VIPSRVHAIPQHKKRLCWSEAKELKLNWDSAEVFEAEKFPCSTVERVLFRARVPWFQSCCGVAPHTLYARRVGRLFDVCKLVASSLK
jgi:hypothetical protein